MIFLLNVGFSFLLEDVLSGYKQLSNSDGRYAERKEKKTLCLSLSKNISYSGKIEINKRLVSKNG